VGEGEIGPDSLVSRGEDAVGERLGEETVVLNTASDRYVRLNATGSLIWEELARPASVSSLAERLQAEFGIDGGSARRDVVSFVHWLRERGVVDVSSR
jgi:hypothetical protein